MISRLTDEEMCTTILEDLEYLYVGDREKSSLLTAIIHLSLRSITLIFPLLVENIFGGLILFKNYFKVALRKKEIGIRKVLGASVTSVTRMLSMDFIKLVLFANLLAWPIAWYAANQWLRSFAFSINIGWWVFLLSGSFALVIALLTVSIQAIRAAVANPIDSLRYE